MSGVVFKFKFPALDARLRKNKDRIYQFIAAQMQTNRALLFDAAGNYNGHKPWAPLKFRSGKPLSARGTLRKSIGPSNMGDKPKMGSNSIVEYKSGIVKIGTNLAYAAIHNNGGVVRAKKAKALKIPLPSGAKATDASKGLRKSEGNFIFRKSVTIPQRNFDEITPQDRQEFNEALGAVLKEVLSGK
jgi:phage gpG-like protein